MIRLEDTTNELDRSVVLRLVFAISHTYLTHCIDTLFLQINTVLVFLHLKFPIVQNFAFDLLIESHGVVITTGIRQDVRQIFTCSISTCTILLTGPSGTC